MKRLIIADDSRLMRNMLGKVLSESFDIVELVNDGNEAFTAFKKHSPDAMLLDVTMPNCDGRECLEMIIKDSPKALVIMVSAIEDQQIIDECLKLGAKAFVNKGNLNFSKPEDINQLIKTINGLFETQQLAEV